MPTRCKSKSDGSVSLPVLDRPERTKRKIGPWRAGVLVLVHVLMVAHIIQWLVMGSTISPIEPSESMQTLEQGLLNAGAIFFFGAIILTVLFGRYVCGWLCHIVALQDFCHWLMGKAGIRPKPFRSRLLMLVPLALGTYMFIWPSFKRYALQPGFEALNLEWPWWLRRTEPFPGMQSEIFVEDFWATFPEWYIAIPFLLVCGFATVYFLGAKAFCTYACPYGGIFALVEPASPTRVRVDHDKCHECGLCTAACTSNVRVHEEIKHFGMVVDAGCMKTMDCISACPNDALSIGLGRPGLAAPVRPEAKESHKAAKVKAARRYDLNWPGEIAAGLVFFFLFIATRGMFDRVPMLMAGGLAAVGTGLTVLLWKTLLTPNARIHRLQLKHKGRIKPAGVAFSLLVLVSWVFAIWGGVGNTTRWRAEALHMSIGVPVDAVLRPEYAPSEKTRARVQKALAWFARADSFENGGIGWSLNADDRVRLAYLHAAIGDYARATDELNAVVDEGNPTDGLVFQLLSIHAAAARTEAEATDPAERSEVIARANTEQLAIMRTALEKHPDLHNVRLRLAQSLWNMQSLDPTVSYDPAIWDVEDPEIANDPKFILNAGQLLALARNTDGMGDVLDRVIATEPDSPAILFEASQLARSIGRSTDAESLVKQGIDAAHDAPTFLAAAQIFRGSGQLNDARRMIDRALESRGATQPGIRFEIGRVLHDTGDPERGLQLMNEAAGDLDHDAWQSMGVLGALAQLALTSQDPTSIEAIITKIESIVAKHPGEPVFRHDLAGYLYAIERGAEAADEIIAAAELGEHNALLADRAGQLLQGLGRSEEAQVWFDRAEVRRKTRLLGEQTPTTQP